MRYHITPLGLKLSLRLTGQEVNIHVRIQLYIRLFFYIPGHMEHSLLRARASGWAESRRVYARAIQSPPPAL